MRNNFYEHTGKERFAPNAAALAIALTVALAAIAALALGICAGCVLAWDIPGDNAPTADAGPDQTRTLANNLTVTLDGSKSEGFGGIALYVWTCVSYTKHSGVKVPYTAAEVSGLINNTNQVTATVALRKAGVYVFRLIVMDNFGARATDDVTVTVNPHMAGVTITASFPGIRVGSTLDFTPVYGDGYEDGDLTYTLEDNVSGTLDDSVVYANTYTAGATITFTQIFFDKSGTELTRQIVKANVDTSAENLSFASLLPATPELDLLLIKPVVEIP